MELTDRKFQILRAVIEEYIAGAQPVGSRMLAKRRDLKLSAATLRNEMADLEEMGYLEKPHTSAGRQPTHNAYRLYVGSMLDVKPLSAVEQMKLGDTFSVPMEEMRQICGTAADAISRMTGLVAVVAVPSLQGTGLGRIQIVRVDSARIVALLVARGGTVREVFIPAGPKLTDEDLRELSEQATSAVEGVRFAEACERLGALYRGAAGSHKHVMQALFKAINRSKDVMDMFLDGRQNIWLHPEYRDWEKARQLFTLLETPEWLEKLFEPASDMEFSVRIGPEAGADLRDLGVVTGACDAGEGNSAHLGVIGPARMNYPQILPVLRSVGKHMSDALSKLIAAGVHC